MPFKFISDIDDMMYCVLAICSLDIISPGEKRNRFKEIINKYNVPKR